MVLYPENGVSGIQKAQMTSMNGPKTLSIGRYFIWNNTLNDFSA